MQKQSSMKASKQIIVDLIIKELKLGKERGEILAIISKNQQLPTRTFDTYFKIAKEEHLKAQQSKKSKISSNDTIKAINEEIDQLMTVAERQSILASIARGELKIKKPFVVSRGATQGAEIVDHECLPDYADRKGAIAELNKMRGDYAPTKVANTDTKGNDVEHYAILPDGTKLKL
jgi:hypothetical protein